MAGATKVQWITIPAGSSPSVCRGPTCGATIYWARSGFGPIPVDCDVDGGQRPSETAQMDVFGDPVDVHGGRGVSHFATCPDADLFRKRDK